LGNLRFGRTLALWCRRCSILTRPVRPVWRAKKDTFKRLYKQIQLNGKKVEWKSYPDKENTFKQSLKLIFWIILKMFIEEKRPVSGNQVVCTRLQRLGYSN
jgi:hypothetical protein